MGILQHHTTSTERKNMQAVQKRHLVELQKQKQAIYNKLQPKAK